MTDLSGRELDEACAKALGWKHIHERVSNEWYWLDPNGVQFSDVPEYHASLDASLRDLWPECRWRGSNWFTIEGPDENAHFWAQIGGPTAIATTPAEAFACACLSALQEVRE